MVEGHENFNEECWIIYGYEWEDDKYGLLVYESEGTAASVDFDWEKVIKNAKIVQGFNHTHPGGHPSPSDIDDNTMKGWVKALGKSLLCGIKSNDEQRMYLYERAEEGIVICREIPFKKVGNLILTIDWEVQEWTYSLMNRNTEQKIY